MRKFLTLLVFVITAFTANAQGRIEIYKTTDGIQNFLPHQVVEKTPEGLYNIYNTTDGIIDYFPSRVVEPDMTPPNYTQDIFRVYDVNNGIPNFIPTDIIIINKLDSDQIIKDLFESYIPRQ
jgi:hypothetical protein